MALLGMYDAHKQLKEIQSSQYSSLYNYAM